MRTIVRTIGGKEFTLTANFAASLRVAQEVADPMDIAREANLEAYFISQGIPYQPRWKFTIENLVRLLCIATGADKEEMEERVFDEGFLEAKEIAVDYLTQIIGPAPKADLSREESSSEKSLGSIS
jgi:hypothetical protein